MFGSPSFSSDSNSIALGDFISVRHVFSAADCADDADGPQEARCRYKLPPALRPIRVIRAIRGSDFSMEHQPSIGHNQLPRNK